MGKKYIFTKKQLDEVIMNIDEEDDSFEYLDDSDPTDSTIGSDTSAVGMIGNSNVGQKNPTTDQQSNFVAKQNYWWSRAMGARPINYSMTKESFEKKYINNLFEIKKKRVNEEFNNNEVNINDFLDSTSQQRIQNSIQIINQKLREPQARYQVLKYLLNNIDKSNLTADMKADLRNIVMEAIKKNGIIKPKLNEKIEYKNGDWYDDGIRLDIPKDYGVAYGSFHRPNDKNWFQNNKEYSVSYYHDGGIMNVYIINDNTGKNDYNVDFDTLTYNVNRIIRDKNDSIYYLLFDSLSSYEIATEIFNEFERFISEWINIPLFMLKKDELMKEKVLDTITKLIKKFRDNEIKNKYKSETYENKKIIKPRLSEDTKDFNYLNDNKNDEDLWKFNQELESKYKLKKLLLSSLPNGWIYIDTIVVKDKGKGYGTAFMKDICEWADENNKILALKPYPLGWFYDTKDESEEWLAQFYQHFGFKFLDKPYDNGEHTITMTRKPNAISSIIENRKIIKPQLNEYVWTVASVQKRIDKIMNDNTLSDTSKKLRLLSVGISVPGNSILTKMAMDAANKLGYDNVNEEILKSKPYNVIGYHARELKNLNLKLKTTPIYFTNSLENAMKFEGRYIYKCNLKLNKPFVIDVEGQDWDQLPLPDDIIEKINYFDVNIHTDLLVQYVSTFLPEYDSVVMLNIHEGENYDIIGNNYIPFNGSQVELIEIIDTKPGRKLTSVDDNWVEIKENINEENSMLKSHTFQVPNDLYNYLLDIYNKVKGNPQYTNLDGYKRLDNIIDRKGKIGYDWIRTIKNYFDNYTGDGSDETYRLNGGNEMKKWINSALNNAQKSIEMSKKGSENAGMKNVFIQTHYKDNSKITTNPEAVSMGGLGIKK